jgi:hypothetical protein
MSTKDILRQERDDKTGQRFHVYSEMLDEDGDVYLELEGFHFHAASSDAMVTGNPQLVVRLPREWAKKIGLLTGEAK